MALRIHFTFADLARTRVSHSTYPLQELSIAMRVLRDRTPSTRFDAWRRDVLTRLPTTARRAFEMTPPHGWVPGFLAPNEAGDVRDLLEQMRATPRRRLREEMQRLAERQAVPSWSRRLGEEPAVLQHLVDSLATAHDVLLAPYWSQVEARLEADRSLRARALLHGGMEQVLSQLHPRRIRWELPVLTVDMVSGVDADLRLEGQGLLLVPSFFGFDAPLIAPDAEPQPRLFYPASADSPSPDIVRPVVGTASSATTLAQLLGRTRAAVLLTVADKVGCTTTELSTAVGISVSNASEHATVLRRAGLIMTTRYRKVVLHTMTPAGHTLLSTASAGPRPAVRTTARQGHAGAGSELPLWACRVVRGSRRRCRARRRATARRCRDRTRLSGPSPLRRGPRSPCRAQPALPSRFISSSPRAVRQTSTCCPRRVRSSNPAASSRVQW